MRKVVLGLAATAAVVGLAGGGVAAVVAPTRTTDAGVADPLPGRHPSVPALPTTPTPSPILTDIPYPTLEVPQKFDRLKIGNGSQTWSYVRPDGWTAYTCSTPTAATPPKQCTEIYWRPADEPLTGGYSLRVQAMVGFHGTTADAVAQRVTGLESAQTAGSITDLQIASQTDNAIYATFLIKTSTGGYLFRENYFGFYAAPGTDEATLSMSVTGRREDMDGLHALFGLFGEKLKALPQS